MAWYRLFVRGGNFFFEMEGKVQRFGFYTNRFVEAPNPGQAELDVVAQLKLEPKLQGHKNTRADPPMTHVEEITEISKNDVPSNIQGLALFVEHANA
jgi:hypothetical protein